MLGLTATVDRTSYYVVCVAAPYERLKIIGCHVVRGLHLAFGEDGNTNSKHVCIQ